MALPHYILLPNSTWVPGFQQLVSWGYFTAQFKFFSAILCRPGLIALQSEDVFLLLGDGSGSSSQGSVTNLCDSYSVTGPVDLDISLTLKFDSKMMHCSCRHKAIELIILMFLMIVLIILIIFIIFIMIVQPPFQNLASIRAYILSRLDLAAFK